MWDDSRFPTQVNKIICLIVFQRKVSRNKKHNMRGRIEKIARLRQNYRKTNALPPATRFCFPFLTAKAVSVRLDPAAKGLARFVYCLRRDDLARSLEVVGRTIVEISRESRLIVIAVVAYSA